MKPQTKANPSSIILVENDGIDHINISFKGKVELGRMLSHFYESPFMHPIYGQFKSMEGFWQYIRASPAKPEARDALRDLSGMAAKECGRNLENVYINNFVEIINYANYQKIIQNPKIAEAMTQSVLPFKIYYLHGPEDILIHQVRYKWIIDGLEEIRTMIREGRVPEPVRKVKA